MHFLVSVIGVHNASYAQSARTQYLFTTVMQMCSTEHFNVFKKIALHFDDSLTCEDDPSHASINRSQTAISVPLLHVVNQSSPSNYFTSAAQTFIINPIQYFIPSQM
uniref:Uncharacterized protein n=1 Tax=Anguilla anguilla TaxID=7936 RepID=A0A0E9XDE1_ANGAN